MTKEEMLVAMQTPEYKLISAVSNSNMAELKLLLKSGVDVSAHEPIRRDTALHIACDKGSKKFASYLISAGAALNSLDRNAMTPLMCACSTGKKKGSEVALLLLEAGADATYVRESDAMDAIKFGLWGDCSEVVLEKLLSAGAKIPPSDFEIIRFR
jgi:ankyrin repeat protein